MLQYIAHTTPKLSHSYKFEPKFTDSFGIGFLSLSLYPIVTNTYSSSFSASTGSLYS